MSELEKAHEAWQNKVGEDVLRTSLEAWEACFAAVLDFARAKAFKQGPKEVHEWMPNYVLLEDLESFAKETK